QLAHGEDVEIRCFLVERRIGREGDARFNRIFHDGPFARVRNAECNARRAAGPARPWARPPALSGESRWTTLKPPDSAQTRWRRARVVPRFPAHAPGMVGALPELRA